MENQCEDQGGSQEVPEDPRQRLEVVFGTHRALLEGTLKVAPGLKEMVFYNLRPKNRNKLRSFIEFY